MKKLCLTAVLALAVAAPLSAQDSARRGLWGGFGAGYGTLSCLDGCDDRLAGVGAFAVLGGTPSPSIRIGGGTAGFYREEDGASLTAGSALFIAQLFPNAGDFYIQGGVGGATLEVEVDAGEFSGSVEDEGGAFLIGLGYTLNLGQSESLAIVPYANWVVTTVEGTFEFFQIGFGLIWN